MTTYLRKHWPEYLMEAAGLGIFMLSACFFTAILEHPGSPVIAFLPDPNVRRALIGVAMGLTAICLIYSPWGKQSGAHYNPAVTLTFFRLGRVAPWDAFFYIVFQFVGGTLGILLARQFVQPIISHPSVNFVQTLPGVPGLMVALFAELAITFILMSVVLAVSSQPSLAKLTGVFAGGCVALFIAFEAPLSGMSMNPARSFASAFAAQNWASLWIYFLAPPLGMILASFLFQLLAGKVACAKMHHANDKRCIFCAFHQQRDISAEKKSA